MDFIHEKYIIKNKKNMELTGECKKQFTEWYKNHDPKSDWKYPAYEYFDNHDIFYRISLLTTFFDQNDIHVMVEPHIGGGQCVFYGKVKYRNSAFIDCEEEVLNGEEPDYSNTRTEMMQHLMLLSNNIFNSRIKIPERPIEEWDEYDYLPF